MSTPVYWQIFPSSLKITITSSNPLKIFTGGNSGRECGPSFLSYSFSAFYSVSSRPERISWAAVKDVNSSDSASQKLWGWGQHSCCNGWPRWREPLHYVTLASVLILLGTLASVVRAKGEGQKRGQKGCYFSDVILRWLLILGWDLLTVDSFSYAAFSEAWLTIFKSLSTLPLFLPIILPCDTESLCWGLLSLLGHHSESPQECFTWCSLRGTMF